MYDDPMPVVVFGCTGLVGGAVARALLRDRRFEVKAVTRTPTTDAARKLAEEGEYGARRSNLVGADVPVSVGVDVPVNVGDDVMVSIGISKEYLSMWCSRV